MTLALIARLPGDERAVQAADGFSHDWHHPPQYVSRHVIVDTTSTSFERHVADGETDLRLAGTGREGRTRQARA